MTRRYLGIDVGGTNSKLAVLEAAGDRPALLATATIPTGTGDPGEVIGRLAGAGARLVAEHGPVAAAGAGVPGLFDEATAGGSCSSPTCRRPGPGRRSGGRWPTGSACRWR